MEGGENHGFGFVWILGFVLKSMYPEEDRSYLSTGYTMVLPYRLLTSIFKTRVYSDSSSTELQCFRLLRHSGAPMLRTVVKLAGCSLGDGPFLIHMGNC